MCSSDLDFESNDVLAGIDFQRKLEQKAYRVGGNYQAPTQLLGDFLKGKTSSRFGNVKPSYSRGTVFANLGEILPKSVANTLKLALPDMGKRLKGFDADDSVLTGVETRFSSPVRVLRKDNGESLNVSGVYPCGEGCGYSGGITSSASDGLRIAEMLFLSENN